jgi:hypothetical protein
MVRDSLLRERFNLLIISGTRKAKRHAAFLFSESDRRDNRNEENHKREFEVSESISIHQNLFYSYERYKEVAFGNPLRHFGARNENARDFRITPQLKP